MNRTIVIAVTDTVLLEILGSRCRTIGLQVETAHRGDDAVRLIGRVRPRLACVQHDLRCTDGRKLCESLASDPHSRAMPLIVLCDQLGESVDLACRATGAYWVPRSGNLWHRLEPLIYELIEETEHLGVKAHIPSDPDRFTTADDHCDGAAASRPPRELRIDEPLWRLMPKDSPGAAASSDSAVPRRDARDSVLDAVFAWFGHIRDARQSAEAADASPAGLSGPHRRDSGEPPWILCIEDDSDFSLALKLRLEAHGIAVVRAFDGRAGYRTAFTHPASAILLDYNLPQGQGDYVLRRLKENPVTAQVPVIVVTGIRSAATRRQMLALGADGYLTKPLDFEALLDTLGEHVDVLPREFASASH